jgi:hypothetical protein
MRNNPQDSPNSDEIRDKEGMMRPDARCFLYHLVVVLGIGLFSPSHANAADPKTGTLSAGGAIGFLANTPDGAAFAFNVNADYFLNRNVSLGPLFQLAATGDLSQLGFSGQGKFWIDLPGTEHTAKLTLQAGLGFVHADLVGSDTSWLIPLGVGVDYTLTTKISFTTTFLLNFTDLDTGGGTDAHVMPGLTFGVRF